MEKTGVKIVAKNSKAFHEYFVEERFEAGIELFGTEVKSIRLGTLNLKDAWCSVKDGELWVFGKSWMTNMKDSSKEYKR